MYRPQHLFPPSQIQTMNKKTCHPLCGACIQCVEGLHPYSLAKQNRAKDLTSHQLSPSYLSNTAEVLLPFQSFTSFLNYFMSNALLNILTAFFHPSRCLAGNYSGFQVTSMLTIILLRKFFLYMLAITFPFSALSFL